MKIRRIDDLSSSRPLTKQEIIVVTACIAIIIFLSFSIKRPVVVTKEDHGTIITLVDEDADGIIDKKLLRASNGRFAMSNPTIDDQAYYRYHRVLVSN